MWRRGHRRPAITRDGDLIIDGHVRARLLGLPLLDLDAHVVVAPARPALPVPASAFPARRLAPPRSGNVDRARRPPAVARPRASLGVPTPPGLAQAEHLIAEGTDLLDEASRIH
jgi:hypothetical protein